VSVTLEHRAIIEEGQRLRGWIANAYAQIEYFLGDLIVRSLGIEAYAGVGGTLPHGSPERIRRVWRILEQDGVFSEFRDEISGIVDEFERHHENRNLLAHGFCDFQFTADNDCGFQFSEWRRDDRRQDARLQKTFRLVDLKYEQAIIVQLSQRAVALFFRIFERLSLVGK
jgi:hypothetical protein